MKKFLLSFLLILPFCFAGVDVQAEELQPFSIEPVLPSNQKAGVTQYISIQAEQDAPLHQELTFRITNNTKEEVTLFIKPTNALTSPNGVIHYTPLTEVENAKLLNDKYSLPKYVTHEDSVTLQGEEEKEISVELDLPPIDGTILGAIGFQLMQEGKTQEHDQSQFKINNEINVIVGVQVDFHTSDTPSYQIGEPFINQMPSYYTVRLPIIFDTPLLQKNAAIEYEVLTKDEQQLFKSIESMKLDFAPKTKVNLSLPWDSNGIKSNETYILRGTLSYGDESIAFEKEFTFEDNGEDEQEIVERGVPDVTEDSTPGWLWLLLLIGVAAGIYAYYKIKNQRKRKYSSKPQTEQKEE